jgi:predicted nuclease of predicted toxin-antitoxin system
VSFGPRRFLLDQSADARLVPFLRSLGHDATRIGAEHRPGLSDVEVLAIASAERRILVTDDRDFGELVVRRALPHAGVIYVRLGDDADLPLRMARLSQVLAHHDHELDQLLTVTHHRVRVRKTTTESS